MIYLLLGILLGVWLDQTYTLPSVEAYFKKVSEEYRASTEKVE